MSSTFQAFVDQVAGFDKLSQTDKIIHTAWYLHARRKKEYVTTSDINACFDEIHAVPPHASVYLKRLAERKPPVFLTSRAGYRLEGGRRKALEEVFGESVATIAISNLLTSLTSKLSSEEERVYLQETLRCYSVKAFRAAIVMSWNLAYSHFQAWITSRDERIEAFNHSYCVKFPKRTERLVSLDSFAEFKEFDSIETAQHAKLLSKNTSEIMKDKLKRRNAAAHPSSVIITQAQADDVITDLVNNVVSRLGGES